MSVLFYQEITTMFESIINYVGDNGLLVKANSIYSSQDEALEDSVKIFTENKNILAIRIYNSNKIQNIELKRTPFSFNTK